jgi:hypothetical protein
MADEDKVQVSVDIVDTLTVPVLKDIASTAKVVPYKVDAFGVALTQLNQAVEAGQFTEPVLGWFETVKAAMLSVSNSHWVEGTSHQLVDQVCRKLGFAYYDPKRHIA